MFTRQHPESELDRQISKLTSLLDTHTVTSDEYGEILDKLEQLHEMRTKDRPDHVKMDTLATIAANLFGIWMLLRYEKAGKTEFISSKALGFVPKLR